MSDAIVDFEAAKTLTQTCIDDFDTFAKYCLKIRTKDGSVVPFRLNRAQRYLNERINKQVAATGKVRQIICKGRQQGLSTLIEGRFYWRLWRSKKALRAFILTHEDPATANLFGMAKRYHDNMPAALRPATKAASAKELLFADNDCGYMVATAGGREVGRSATIQLFHGSEIPSWPNAAEHIAGVFQALSKQAGSEAILEATAKGVGNVFHTMAMAALKGDSEFELTFIPWFWEDGYRVPCPAGLAWSEDWLEYGYLHKLDWDQLYWAFLENRTIAQAFSESADKPCAQFHQEYPATVELAFQTSGNSFIPALSVLRARRAENITGHGPIILGVDPARSGDKIGIIDRCGRRMGERICKALPPPGNSIIVAQMIADQIDRIRPDATNIDVGNMGATIVDLLLDWGYSGINAVNFGGKPIGKGPTGDRMYFNRRAEMSDLAREWFETEGGVLIPDDDALQLDLTSAVWGDGACRYNSNNQLIIEEKDKIKQRLGHSPDLYDAAILTFAVPMSHLAIARNIGPPSKRRTGRAGY